MKKNKEGGSNKRRSTPLTRGQDGPGIFALTGIPAIDTILDTVRDEGGLIVVGSHSYEDRVTLGCQIAGRLLNQYRSVRFMGNSDVEHSIVPRIISSMDMWPMMMEEGVWRLKWDYVDEMSVEDSERILRPHEIIARRMSFLGHSGSVISKSSPDCLILDLFDWDGHGNSPLCEGMRGYAHQQRVPVVALCEFAYGDGMDARTTGEISEVGPTLRKYADYVIGISNTTMDLGKNGFEDAPRQDQCMTVRRRRGEDILVPVLRDDVYQRYLPREEAKGSSELESGV